MLNRNYLVRKPHDNDLKPFTLLRVTESLNTYILKIWKKIMLRVSCVTITGALETFYMDNCCKVAFKSSVQKWSVHFYSIFLYFICSLVEISIYHDKKKTTLILKSSHLLEFFITTITDPWVTGEGLSVFWDQRTGAVLTPVKTILSSFLLISYCFSTWFSETERHSRGPTGLVLLDETRALGSCERLSVRMGGPHNCPWQDDLGLLGPWY